MSWIQRFFLAVLPRRWAEDMRADSESWRIRCETCGHSRSIWEAGGIRWKATSTKKRTLLRCSHCGALRRMAIERTPPPGR